MYGSDTCFAGSEDQLPILPHLEGLRGTGGITAETFGKIAGGNALRILKRLVL